MKKHLISCAATLCVALTACSNMATAQDETFELKSTLKNFAADTLIVYKGQGAAMDTILTKKDKFTYTAKLSEPAQWVFATPAAFKGDPAGKVVNIVAIPGEKAELYGDMNNGRYDITGSKFYKEYHEMDLLQEEAQKPLQDLQQSLMAKMKAGVSQEEVMKEYEEKAPALEKALSEKLMEFIAKHPSYECCAVLVGQFQSIEEMEKAAGLLSDGVKNGRMKSMYEPLIARAKAQEEAEKKAEKVQAAGAEATDFTLKDIKGNDFTLSSLRGKYVVLDFWGSWCGWCIKGMPQMKDYYKKYAGKFEIVGVDCNDTQEKWKAAVEKHQLPWLHVYNPRGGENDVCQKYAINGFPTKIVVGPDGKIVKTVVGEDPAFYTFLDETFGK